MCIALFERSALAQGLVQAFFVDQEGVAGNVANVDLGLEADLERG